MRVSVVIPTFRRPTELTRCLDALKRQESLPDEVLVAIRDDDSPSQCALAKYESEALPLRVVSAGAAGASEARNRCINQSSGDVLVMTDDDTMPRPDWVARIRDRFAADPALGGLGGPDWIGGCEVPPEERASVVGTVQWWGRRVGNHHRGAHQPLLVEWLKGANMSFRREALHGTRFGRHLRGTAAQFGEDFAVSLHVKRSRWKLIYDPAVCVDHCPGELMAGTDHRGLRDTASLVDACHNETVVLLDYLPPLRRLAFLAWSAVVGTRLLPGALMAFYLLLTRGQLSAFKRCQVVLRGRRAGWRTWQAARQRPVPDRVVSIADQHHTTSAA